MLKNPVPPSIRCRYHYFETGGRNHFRQHSLSEGRGKNCAETRAGAPEGYERSDGEMKMKPPYEGRMGHRRRSDSALYRIRKIHTRRRLKSDSSTKRREIFRRRGMKNWRASLSNEGRRLSTPSLSSIRKRLALLMLRPRWKRARTVLSPERKPKRKNFSPSSTRYPTRYPDTASAWLRFRLFPKRSENLRSHMKIPRFRGIFYRICSIF